MYNYAIYNPSSKEEESTIGVICTNQEKRASGVLWNLQYVDFKQYAPF